MMIKAFGFAAHNTSGKISPFEFTRREPRANEILIEIDFCGICHSDIHQVKNEWQNAVYPMVPGHEIVGHITKIGSSVTKFKIGDLAGVGCLVDSCRACASCQAGLEQFCDQTVGTYNSLEKDGVTRTYGGYSNCIILNQDFALKIPKNLDLKTVAPLLCAGITTYSPLKYWNVSKGQKVKPGQTVGKSGGKKGAAGAGNSTGPHLHFEFMTENGVKVDPAPLPNPELESPVAKARV
jgi:uncharacterized zinc-type alcohol dehydrogenase-like protein